MARDTLLILPSLKAVRIDADHVIATEKFIEGMAEYACRWEGATAAILEPADRTSNNLDNLAVDTRSLPFALQVLPFDDRRMLEHLAAAAVVVGGPDYRQNHLAGWCRRVGTPYVMNTEYTEKTRRQIAAVEESNPLRRWRRYWWEHMQERAVRRSVAAAAGVQCNGVPTYEAYRRLNANCLTYFDTRVTEAMMPTEARVRHRLSGLLRGEPLRLAFSGRLIAMKGADHLPRIAVELRNLGVPFSLSIFGAGALEDSLREAIEQHQLGDCVRLEGVANFKSELMPHLQDAVDLFVCTHRQGDPSCTYLETLACGVPIVGYANEAWTGLLAEAEVGSAVAVDDAAGLARAVAALHKNRKTAARLSWQAWQFAALHTFERTFAARIAHLRECADLPAHVVLA